MTHPLDPRILTCVSTLLLTGTAIPTASAATERAVNFQNRGAGTYTLDMANQDFSNIYYHQGLGTSRAQILAFSDGGKVLQVKFPKGTYGVNSGIQFNPPYTGRDEYYMDYRIKFTGSFDWKLGGKIPGLAGGSAPTNGGYKSDGMSARLMWRENGRAVIYCYWADQASKNNSAGTQYGQDFALNMNFATNTSYYITQRVKLNTAGQYNGIIQVWVNGALKFSKTDFRFRLSGASWKVNRPMIHFYHGGNDSSWAPGYDCYCIFDDFKLYYY